MRQAKRFHVCSEISTDLNHFYCYANKMGIVIIFQLYSNIKEKKFQPRKNIKKKKKKVFRHIYKQKRNQAFPAQYLKETRDVP